MELLIALLWLASMMGFIGAASTAVSWTLYAPIYTIILKRRAPSLSLKLTGIPLVAPINELWTFLQNRRYLESNDSMVVKNGRVLRIMYCGGLLLAGGSGAAALSLYGLLKTLGRLPQGLS